MLDYVPRKNVPVVQSTLENLDIIILDWYECDLLTELPIEKKDIYLNQDHNKQYTIFIFGVTKNGNSVCLRVKNYLPYFYVQMPENFSIENIKEFINNFNINNVDEYDNDDISNYEEAISEKNFKKIDEFKFKSHYYIDSIVTDKCNLVEKKIFWSFMNEQKFNFVKLAFKSKMGYQFMEKMLKNNTVKLKITNNNNNIKYNLFESDLEPVLRFIHDKKIKPASWIRIPSNKFKLETIQSKSQINISCDWMKIQPLDKTEIPPLLIASFDIEADSSHGDFPIAKKDCKKLANQLVICWIREQRIINKKQHENILNNLHILINKQHNSINTQADNGNGNSIENNNYNTILDLIKTDTYIDKKDINYDKDFLIKIKKTFTILMGKTKTKTKTNTNKHNFNNDNNDNNDNNNNNDNILSRVNMLLLQYYRELIKYLEAKQNILLKHNFFDIRIKQALGFEEYKNYDSDIDFIYLKNSMRAKQFVNGGNDYNELIKKIYNICNRPIRKVKANMIMKKAQNEVMAIETAKMNKNDKLNIDDLVKIINETAMKYKILNKDLQDKIIVKDLMVRYINVELNRVFGFAKGDHVIQIGTVFWRYGDPTPCHNNIITLNSCDKFNIGENPCEIISRDLERDLLLEWAKLIELHDPDIIIGYNTFGFDESFMYDRITDLILNTDRMNLTKEDMKNLDTNHMYNKFIHLGRFDENILKKVPDAKGRIINKKLSSSALGDNFLYYFNTPGRVQIDLLKVCQASLTKLPSYTLDSVSEYYISGKIKDIIINNTQNNKQNNLIQESPIIKVDNIGELEVGNYIVISMSSTTAKLFDGEKMKILSIDKEKNYITLDRSIPKNCLSSIPLWGLGKDDVNHQDIFRLQKGTSTDRAIIAKYCIQDCALLIRLLSKLEVINNNFGMANVCIIPFSYTIFRGQGIKAFSLITNECAKEDFVLPVLERIEQEEMEVDDSIRRQHTQFAIQQEKNDEDGDNLLDDDNDNYNNDDNNNNTYDNTRNNTRKENDKNIEDDEEEDDEEYDDEDDEHDNPKNKRFELNKNFNKVIMTEDSYEGALVMKPLADIYTEDPITVLDFSSLYPSEMITSDLSHDRICEDPYWLGPEGIKRLEKLGLGYLDRSYDNFEWIDPTKKSKGKRKCGVTTVRYVQYPDGRKGLIPRILMGLLSSRKATKKLMEASDDPFKKALLDGLQLAYKVTANSVYGQIGARTSKMYKPQIAASVTAGGRLRIRHAQAFLSEHFPGTIVVYGDTDSAFFKFKLVKPDGTLPTTDIEKIQLAIEKGQMAEKELKKVLPGVHCMAYEKVLFPFILISKKRYFALKYEEDPTKYKQISMGLILKRRDNAPILKHCYIGVLDSLVKEKNIQKAVEYIQNECKKMINGMFDMNMFVISKTLSSYYKDPEAIAHAILAQRMAERDPGNKPQSNERIPYVFIKIKEEVGVDYLQGDRIEHVDYVRKNKLKVDYEKYILNQIMKPVSQLFELVVEKLPNFPYGRGYYEEMYNIWYNKYDGDELKTEKKIRQLKAQMVQKLIFDTLIQYVRIKTSNTKTIDDWFKPQESVNQPIIKTHNKVEIHDKKIKKTKQLSLDSFF